MRILHCSWEYPPIVFGGLGRHVDALTHAQAQAGHDVVVLTQAPEPTTRRVNGVRVIGIPPDAPHVPLDPEHLLPWVLGFNSGLTRAGSRLLATWRPDVVHGHDWLVAHSSMALASIGERPYVTTVHATEAGRHQGWLPGMLSRSIHSIEWWSVDHASRVIACSAHMRQEIVTLFGTTPERIAVIPNGVAPVDWEALQAKRRADRSAHGRPLVVFAGRLEWEKGVHTLIDAMGAVRRAVPQAHLVIAGRGSAEQRLRDQVRTRRLGRNVTFAGWVPADDLQRLVACADAAVVPSLYEPFGLVALEAASVGAPLVVARTGGLAEVVRDPQTGWTFTPGKPRELASCVIAALSDPRAARQRARRARARLAVDFGWPMVAERTIAAYRDAIDTYRSSVTARDPRASYLVSGTANLLTGATE